MNKVESVLEFAHDQNDFYFHVGTHIIDGGLKCPVCYSIFKNPVISVPCGHSFCNKCLCRSKHTSLNCPVCRQPIQCNVPNHSLKFLVDSLENAPYQKEQKKSKNLLLERPIFQSEKKARNRFQFLRAESIGQAEESDSIFAKRSRIDQAFQKLEQDIEDRQCFPIYHSCSDDDHFPQRDVHFKGLTSDSQTDTYSYY